MMTAVKEQLTDPQYWDVVWKSARPRRLSDWHPYFGRNGAFMKMIHRYAGSVKGLRVLEVGAGGDNHRLLALAKWGGAVVSAIDYSRVGLRVLRDTFEINGCQVAMYEGDILKHDFEGAVFDMVVHWGVIEHFAEPGPLLGACANRLPVAGRLLFTMPNMLAFAARWWRKYSPANWALHILHEDAILKRACSTASFTPLDSFFFGLPALKMAPWEYSCVASSLINHAQRLATLSALLLPFDRGLRCLSSERGFTAVKTGY